MGLGLLGADVLAAAPGAYVGMKIGHHMDCRRPKVERDCNKVQYCHWEQNKCKYDDDYDTQPQK